MNMDIPIIASAEFTVSVHQRRQLPPAQLPEAAFLGRSNVGKSSLINTLLGRKKLVRTSSRPGCTQALNFFLINEAWYFVDLPGYGYARVSRETKAGWGSSSWGTWAAGQPRRPGLSPGPPAPPGGGRAVFMGAPGEMGPHRDSGAHQG